MPFIMSSLIRPDPIHPVIVLGELRGDASDFRVDPPHGADKRDEKGAPGGGEGHDDTGPPGSKSGGGEHDQGSWRAMPGRV
jgi:hypothetical protein